MQNRHRSLFFLHFDAQTSKSTLLNLQEKIKHIKLQIKSMAIPACRDFREISGLKGLPNGTKHCKIIARLARQPFSPLSGEIPRPKKVHDLTCRQKLSTENSNQKNGNHCLQRFQVSKTSPMAKNMVKLLPRSALQPVFSQSRVMPSLQKYIT